MSAEENKAVVARIVEMFNAGRFDALSECVAGDLVLHSDLVREPKGTIEDFRELLGIVRGGFPEGRMSPEEITAEDDRVALRFMFAGTHLGTIKGNHPTGRSVFWREALFFRFGPGGKVVELWHVINVMEVLEKLGALPPEKVRERIAQVLSGIAKLRSLIGGGR